MANVYAARKRLLVGEEWRQPGDLVPEAAGWRNLHSYISSGAIVLVQTDDVQAYGMKQHIPTDTQLDPLTARVGATNHQQHAGWGHEVLEPDRRVDPAGAGGASWCRSRSRPRKGPDQRQHRRHDHRHRVYRG